MAHVGSSVRSAARFVIAELVRMSQQLIVTTVRQDGKRMHGSRVTKVATDTLSEKASYVALQSRSQIVELRLT